MAETLAQLAAALNKARGAWVALIAIGTVFAGGMFALGLFIATQNADRIRVLREDVTEHESRIARLEGALKMPPKEKK